MIHMMRAIADSFVYGFMCVCVCRFYEKDLAMLHKLLAVPEKDIEVKQTCSGIIRLQMF